MDCFDEAASKHVQEHMLLQQGHPDEGDEERRGPPISNQLLQRCVTLLFERVCGSRQQDSRRNLHPDLRVLCVNGRTIRVQLFSWRYNEGTLAFGASLLQVAYYSP